MERTAVIADEHRIVAEGVAALLAQVGWRLEPVADGAELLRRCAARRFGAAIINLSSPPQDGFALLRAARATALETPIVALSAHADAALVRQALIEGARGFVSKAMAANELHRALEAVALGKFYVAAGDDTHAPALPDRTLTERELQVARLLSNGKRAKQVAYELGVSTRTVESHKYSAMQKREVSSVMELMFSLRAEGLLP